MTVIVGAQRLTAAAGEEIVMNMRCVVLVGFSLVLAFAGVVGRREGPREPRAPLSSR